MSSAEIEFWGFKAIAYNETLGRKTARGNISVLIDSQAPSLETVTAPPELALPVESSLTHAVQALLKRQDNAGWWIGEDEANCTLDSEYIFFLHYRHSN